MLDINLCASVDTKYVLKQVKLQKMNYYLFTVLFIIYLL